MGVQDSSRIGGFRQGLLNLGTHPNDGYKRDMQMPNAKNLKIVTREQIVSAIGDLPVL
jgi:hypothetical protein